MNSTNIANYIVKNVDHKKIIDKVQKMVNHFNANNFINTSSNQGFQFDFNSENLKQNIKNEWILTNTVLCDQPSFLIESLKNENLLKNAFEKVKSLVPVVPFSFVEIQTLDLKKKLDLSTDETNAVDLVKSCFQGCCRTGMKNITFCAPSEAVEFFHKQQRDRKIWWRKFSALPGRFHITKIFNDENSKSQFVEIQAEFPWGLETVEIIKYLPELLVNDSSFYEMKSQRKKILPQVVTSETSLEKVTLTYLCDSYEGINEETDREMLRFSKKLAPYKVAFAASGTSAETVENLKNLALLLAKKIRKCGVSALLLPDVCATTIEKQLIRNDALGVPYTILLNEKTLKDGIISFRSRDTTLKEQSHVSLIVSYLEKLMKTY